MKIRNAVLYDGETRRFRRGGLCCENGTITELREAEGAADFEGDLLIPGLIDVHTHGRGGYDFLTASVDELKKLKRQYALRGVTTVVPTIASAPLPEMLDAVDRIREAGFRAVHIEGRYLSPSRRGAHAASLLAPLDPAEPALFADRAGGMKLHLSAAYERDPDGAFLSAVLACGATAGLAHTDATFEEATALVGKGLRSFTHLFNTMPPLHHRAGGAALAGLLTDAYVEVICDGLHLAPETVALIGRVKDPSRVVLISDSMEGTGCPDGSYSIAGNPVVLRDGRAYTAEGALAGSTLSLFDGVRNYAEFCGIPPADALGAATANPADMLGLADVGRLKPGCRADFVRLSADFGIKEVYVAGQLLSTEE